MILANTLIWTKRGWRHAEELIIGDVVISYNSSRNCTEYDEISNIKMDYGSYPIFGVKTHSLSIAATSDHPFILVNKRTREVERTTIDDVFLSSIRTTKSVLYTAPFEPYLVSQNMDDVAWSARVAASFSFTRYMPIEYVNQIWDIMDDCCGLEAQHWLDIFFHWNVLQGGTYWSKAIILKNMQVRDMVYNFAPRAGFGARFMPNPKRPGGPWIMGLSIQRNPEIYYTQWFRDRVTDYVFNIKTRNGNFLARRTGGTFLCACEIT